MTLHLSPWARAALGDHFPEAVARCQGRRINLGATARGGKGGPWAARELTHDGPRVVDADAFRAVERLVTELEAARG
jgi:hypothetical protein